jgi:hypothetical protein
MQANDMADMEETGSQPISYVELSGLPLWNKQKKGATQVMKS